VQASSDAALTEDGMSRWLSIALLLTAPPTWASDVPKVLIPQVWVNSKDGQFHSPRCKRITGGMIRIARTVAKAQGYTSAKECALTDDAARKQWAEELKKGDEKTTRSGRVADRSRDGAPPPLATTTTRGSSSRAERTPERRPDPPPAPVSWNDLMAAQNFMDADRVIREQCAREWPTDLRMFGYCADRQKEAATYLKRMAPTGVDQEAFNRKRVECARSWPTDYRMRVYCETH
jgi:hypothetical protein